MARSISGSGYQVAGADGDIVNFGDAGFFGSIPTASPPINLAKPVVGVAATPSGQGYWLVAADGGVFTFGDAGFFGSIPGLSPPITLAKPVVGMAATPKGEGYWLVAADGGVFTFGDAVFFGSVPGGAIAFSVFALLLALQRLLIEWRRKSSVGSQSSLKQ